MRTVNSWLEAVALNFLADLSTHRYEFHQDPESVEGNITYETLVFVGEMELLNQLVLDPFSFAHFLKPELSFECQKDQLLDGHVVSWEEDSSHKVNT